MELLADMSMFVNPYSIPARKLNEESPFLARIGMSLAAGDEPSW